jgi:ribosomal-protein-alanine N-acetyltransferase
MAVGWIGTHVDAAERGESVTLAITEKDGSLVGAVALAIAHAHRRAELGYWIAVPHWGRGYATEAAAAMVDYAFGTLELRRVVARCLTRNAGSVRVMEKLGMQREGCLRAHVLKWDVPEDVALYAVLRDEWPRVTHESGSAR